MTDRSCSDHALVRALRTASRRLPSLTGAGTDVRSGLQCVPLPLLKPAVCCVKQNRHAGYCGTRDTRSVAAGGTYGGAGDSLHCSSTLLWLQPHASVYLQISCGGVSGCVLCARRWGSGVIAGCTIVRVAW